MPRNRFLHSQERKKADMAEHAKVFHHVGLLVNEPPGMGRVALYLVIRQKHWKVAIRRATTLPSLSLYTPNGQRQWDFFQENCNIACRPARAPRTHGRRSSHRNFRLEGGTTSARSRLHGRAPFIRARRLPQPVQAQTPALRMAAGR
jgi:hypothetical protein